MKLEDIEKTYTAWLEKRTESGGILSTAKAKVGMVRLNTLFPHKQVYHDQRTTDSVLVSGYFSRNQLKVIKENIKTLNTQIQSEIFHPLGLLRFIDDATHWTGISMVEVGILCKNKPIFEEHCNTFRAMFPLHDVLFHTKQRKTENNADIFLDGYKIIRLYHIPYEHTKVSAIFWLSLPTNAKKYITHILSNKKLSLSVRGLFRGNTLLSITHEDQITALIGLPNNYLKEYYSKATQQQRKLLKGVACKAYPSVKTERKKITLVKQTEAIQTIIIEEKQKQELKDYENFKKQLKQQAKQQSRKNKKPTVDRNTELSICTTAVPDESAKARDGELRKKTAKILKAIRRKGIRISGATVPINKK